MISKVCEGFNWGVDIFVYSYYSIFGCLRIALRKISRQKEVSNESVQADQS